MMWMWFSMFSLCLGILEGNVTKNVDFTNPLCKELQDEVFAFAHEMSTLYLDGSFGDPFFWVDCSAHDPMYMTFRFATEEHKCRIGFMNRLYERWDKNPFHAQCKVYADILDTIRQIKVRIQPLPTPPPDVPSLLSTITTLVCLSWLVYHLVCYYSITP